MLHLTELKFSSPAQSHHVRETIFIGVVPIITSFLLALSLPLWNAPIAWMMFGFSTGVMGIFVGTYRAYDDYKATLWFSRRIQNTADRWFPYLVLTARNIFIMMAMLVIYKCFTVLELKLSMLTRITFWCTLGFHPLKTFIAYFEHGTLRPWTFRIHSFIRHASTASITLFTISIILSILTGATEKEPETIALITVWVPGITIIVLTVMLLIQDLISGGKKTSSK